MFKIKNDIYWVGYIDWDIRIFHGYLTQRGSTYNAYLIMDEKPTLIDTVKHYGFEDMLKKIKEVIDPAEIRYIIANHAEMDHSGSIDKLLELCPNAEVVCSTKGVEIIKRHFKKDWKFKAVADGETLSIGKRTLTFKHLPMIHWPESMATYSGQDKILFPNDAFGQHYASDERFADEVDEKIIYHEAAKYYANIIMPYGNAVLRALETLAKLEIDTICPSHGLMWRKKEQIQEMMKLYKKWASYQTESQVVIVYETMWHSTEKMANAIKGFLDKEKIPCKVFSLQETHYSDVVTEIQSARVVLFGSSMLNNRVLPTMASLLMYIKGLRPKNRFAMTFGSYGWAKVGFKEFEESLKEAGFELLGEGKYIQFIPDESELDKLSEIVPLIKEKLDSK